jgi:heme oxygenase (staphylobilin-producing)
MEVNIMFVITNRIKTKKGFARHMAPAFTKNSEVKQFEGFIKTEVLVSSDNKEFDELNVNMYWDSLENFKVWRESDAFKRAHQRPSGSSSSEDSPLLGSELVISEVVSSTE